MSLDPKTAAAEILRRRRARNNFSSFVRFAFTVLDPGADLKWSWYLDALCEYLTAVYQGDIRKLLINIPPRTLKSIVASVSLPAWVIGRHPYEQFLCASGGQNLATELSIKTRTLIQHPWYKLLFPDVELASDQDTKSMFKTSMQGHRYSTSVGTRIIGFGGNYLITDDLNVVEDAFSPNELEKVNRWFDQTLSSRANDKNTAKWINIQQRIATNDITAHLLEMGGWEQVLFPRVFELRTTYNLPISKKEVVKEAGETLHPERMGLELVEEEKKTLGPYGWASQQQQKPTALGGNRIKSEWFRRFSTQGKAFDEKVQTWDTANKGKDIDNKSACLTFGRIDNVWRLIDVNKGNWVYPELRRNAFSLQEFHKPNFILVEDKASGQQLIQEMQVKKLPVIPIQPKGSKDSRMNLEIETGALENGLIALPDGVNISPPWLFEFEQRLQEFPNPLEWDELDAFSQFLKWLRERQTTVEYW